MANLTPSNGVRITVKHGRQNIDAKGIAYSCLAEVDDQTIGILYESSAEDMIFQKIPLKDFTL